MNKSDSIIELAKALSKMQSQVKNSEMDGENPYFGNRYSTLSSIWDACRTPLTENGLSILQTAVSLPGMEEWVSIETTLLHISGEWVSGVMSAKMGKFDPQAVGSCVTYLRRYSLAAICGISPADDDDGNATVIKGSIEKYEYNKDLQQNDNTYNTEIIKEDMASDKQVKAIYAIIKARLPNTDHCLWINDALGLLGKEEELERVSSKTVTKDMVKKIFDKFILLGWVKNDK
jgi:hypothetical protein